MMAAAQPFLSGAISKTVNLPNDCTVDDIAEAYMESWRQGIKAVAIYRDGSKGAQPLNVSTDADKKKDADEKKSDAAAALTSASGAVNPEELRTLSVSLDAAQQSVSTQAAQIAALHTQLAALTAASNENADALDSQRPPRAVRHRLPAERASVTHKFGLAGHEGYITVGLYPNGQPGEIFIRMAKEGSTVSGLMDSFATAISLALQHGVPLRVLCEKFAHTRFEPSGWTGNEQIGYAKSIMDYIFRWIQIRFLSGQQLDLFAGLSPKAAVPVEGTVNGPANTVVATAPHAGMDAESKDAAHHRTAAAFQPPPSFPDTYFDDRSAPQQGIAPDLQASNGLTDPSSSHSAGGSDSVLSFEDRGIYHAADAMKDLYDMGDSPSCATCGSIMTRSGSCYRCMSCGNTSGCS
jgi:ribonucleoside-diphosphate reductase alpha chain